MELLKTITIDKEMKRGETLVEDLLGTGVRLIVTTHVGE